MRMNLPGETVEEKGALHVYLKKKNKHPGYTNHPVQDEALIEPIVFY